MNIHWIIERMHQADTTALADAAIEAGARVSFWDDAWWDDHRFPVNQDDFVLFHGSLSNAARIKKELSWSPGAYCNSQDLAYSQWAPQIQQILLSPDWLRSTVSELASDPAAVLSRLGSPSRVFVRPDSPLKAFSGRTLGANEISLSTLDHGFYYDDASLPVIVAPAVPVGREWRFVIVDRAVVAHSGYLAEGRKSSQDQPPQVVLSMACTAASRLEVVDPAYILDLAEVDDGCRVVELNPFSGADLYCCDRNAVVAAIAALACRTDS